MAACHNFVRRSKPSTRRSTCWGLGLAFAAAVSSSTMRPISLRPCACAVAPIFASKSTTFARTLSQHSERQSDLIDVFATALKELQTELHRSKMRSQTLQNRLDLAEARIAELEKVVMAMRRQGWVN